MRQRMLDGVPYIADEELGALHTRAAELVSAYNTTLPGERARRHAILGRLLAGIGSDTEIRPPLQVDYGFQVTVGARTFINAGLVALDVSPIVIGDDVQIGPSVQLLTPMHPVDPEPRRAKWESGEPITIEDNVWLGGGAIVCPGVRIGSDTVVGAGAVVVSDLPPGVLAVGNPARVLRRVDGSESI